MKIGFIGAGNMGGALALSAAQDKENEIYIYDIDNQKADILAQKCNGVSANIKTLCEKCEYVFLGVKPQVLSAALSPIKEDLEKSDAVLVSMAAGVTLATLRSIVNMPIIRIMPNMPVGVGEGMTVYCKTADVLDEDAKSLVYAMRFSGKWDAVNERDIDAVTALSGCGPAFVFKFIKALINSGIQMGLSEEKAKLYATQTVMGAAKQLWESERDADALIDAVCSPGGSTIEGIKTLSNQDFEEIVETAVEASFKRTQEMGKR